MVAGAQAKMRPSTGREINVLNEQPAILDRLDDQISWYDRKSQSAQKRYKVLKLVQGSRQELCVAVRHRRTNRKLDVGLPYLPWNSNTSRQRETRDGQCRHSTAISRSAISC